MAVPVLPVPGRCWRRRRRRAAVPTRGEGSSRCPGEEHGPEAASAEGCSGEDVPGEGWTDGRMDRGAPAVPGAAWGAEPREEAGLPAPRPTLPPALHVAPSCLGTALPAPARRRCRTARLQLEVQLMDGSRSVYGPSSFAAPAGCGSSFFTAPAGCGSSFFTAPGPAPGQLQFSFGPSSFEIPISGPAH
ncbi:skin secretory protein xP2-like [Grus americana]|uniref:skin secretory protein xP2-like n=1 Tax=Grus americana TaxID=9117 RepID=UPI0024086D16|nr:skin secretory protein xP2-like [Grus americana]